MIYTEIPFYGYRKVHQQLIERGFSVGVNRVRSCMRELGLKTIYPTKAVKTTLVNADPYLLKDIALVGPIRFGAQISPMGLCI